MKLLALKRFLLNSLTCFCSPSVEYFLFLSIYLFFFFELTGCQESKKKKKREIKRVGGGVGREKETWRKVSYQSISKNNF